jgi:NAD-dependent deacetylase
MIEIPQSVISRCRDAKRIGVLTGAGISAESGLATFRGEDGIWTKLNPLELASMDAFLKNPSRVWEWYEHRRNIMLNVEPNEAHFTLAAMEAAYPHFSISTQNIDGLHQRAGSRTVHELHGNIARSRCSECNTFVDDVELKKDSIPPRCRCGGIIRPDVVWFGEMLPQDALEQAHEAARSADVYFSIGTSAVVYPAAQLPYEAAHHGAFVVEINLQPTDLTPHADSSLRGKAGQILPQLWQAVQKSQEI